LRRLFVCDYLSHADFRREVLRILNHDESVHTLQRQAINLRGVLQPPVGRCRNRLILATPSGARRRANATTGDEHQSQEALDSVCESDLTDRQALDFACS
jgi:hypothetical protein